MIDYKRLSKDTFDREAAGFDGPERPGHIRTLYPQLRPILAELTFASALDIGCGTGELLARLPEWGKIRLAGLDIAPNMVAAAREKLGPGPDLRVGDAESLPWESASFDLVLCTNSFHHYPDPDRSLAEMRRVLKRNGHLLLADITPPEALRWIINRLLPLMRTGDVHFYSENETRPLLVRNSFQVIRSQTPVPGSFIVIAQPK
jgi:ubiquinone/menaquinone biosynthesis C-methylase UbiE